MEPYVYFFQLTAQQPKSGFWLGTEVLCWPIHRVPYKMFPFLSLTVIQTHNTTFTLNISPQQYLRPVGGGTENEDCYKFAIASSDSGMSYFSLNISPQQYLRPVGGGTENEDCYKFAIASSDSGMSYKSGPFLSQYLTSAIPAARRGWYRE